MVLKHINDQFSKLCINCEIIIAMLKNFNLDDLSNLIV